MRWRPRDPGIWRKTFAFLPVDLVNGERVWLEVVYVRSPHRAPNEYTQVVPFTLRDEKSDG